MSIKESVHIHNTAKNTKINLFENKELKKNSTLIQSHHTTNNFISSINSLCNKNFKFECNNNNDNDLINLNTYSNLNYNINSDTEDSDICLKKENLKYIKDIEEYADIKKVYFNKKPQLNVDLLENPWKANINNNYKDKEYYLDATNISQSFFGNFDNQNNKNNNNINNDLSRLNNNIYNKISNSSSIKQNNIKYTNNNCITSNYNVECIPNLNTEDKYSQNFTDISALSNNNSFNNNILNSKESKKSNNLIINDKKLKEQRLKEIKRNKSVISVVTNNSNNLSIIKPNNTNLSINKASVLLESNNSISEDKSDYSSMSSASDFEMNNINTYNSPIYSLIKIERKLIPKAVEFYLKINKQNDNDNNTDGLNFIDHFNADNITEKDIYKRYGKLIETTLFVYESDISQKLIISIDLNDTYNEIGPIYKINNNNNLKCTNYYYYSFTIYNNEKSFTFYSVSEDSRNSWIKEINKAIGFNNITDLYSIKKEVYKRNNVTVNIAKRKSDLMKIAIKTINKYNLSLDKINSIKNETSIIKNFKHPYIVKFYEKIEDKSYIYNVYEYCDGYNLVDYIKRFNFIISEALACKLIFQICCAVGYMHSYKILHRDIRPENILITNSYKNPEVRLNGFSRCIMMHGKKLSTDFESILVYSAPEIILNKPYSYSIDIWCIGIIAHLLLTGKIPFKGENDKILTENILKKEINFDSELWSNQTKEAKFFVGSKFILLINLYLLTIKIYLDLLSKKPEDRMSILEILDYQWFYMWNKNINCNN